MTLASKDTEFIIYSDIAFFFKHFPTLMD